MGCPIQVSTKQSQRNMGSEIRRNMGPSLAIQHFSRFSLQMCRPPRLEIAYGLYHVTSRGDRREDIYHVDADRLT